MKVCNFTTFYVPFVLFFLSYIQAEVIHTKKGLKLYFNSCFCGDTAWTDSKISKRRQKREVTVDAFEVGDIKMEDSDKDNLKFKMNLNLKLNVALNLTSLNITNPSSSKFS